jgi:hypothetical protein
LESIDVYQKLNEQKIDIKAGDFISNLSSEVDDKIEIKKLIY